MCSIEEQISSLYDTRQDKRKHYLGKKALQHFQIPPFQHNPEYGVLICRDGETQSKIAYYAG